MCNFISRRQAPPGYWPARYWQTSADGRLGIDVLDRDYPRLSIMPEACSLPAVTFEKSLGNGF